MEIKSTKDSVVLRVDENKQAFIQVSEKIWEIPELAMEEKVAAALVADLLEQHGFVVQRGVAGMPTAFTACWGNGQPVLGFLAEYDALPGLSQEKDSLVHEPVRPGAPGHGCGHNLMAIGGPLAAIALKQELEQQEKSCTIKVFGTPAEELMIGKPFMARSGCFDGVDVFLDWHPMSENSANAFFNNGYFNINYYFKGQTCHGNAPWFGKSTLDAAMLTAHGIEMLREHLPPGDRKAATTINYALPDVGNAFPNVVPDRTTLWVIGRGEDADLLKLMIERLHQCARGCAMATGTEVTHEILTAVPNMIPNLTISELVDKNFHEIGTAEYSEEEQQDAIAVQKAAGLAPLEFTEKIKEFGVCGMPASDASQLTWLAPYGALQVQVLPNEKLGWHNWAVARFAGKSAGMKAAVTAAKVMACTAIDLLENPEIIHKAKAEWNEKIGQAENKFLLPWDAKPPLDISKEAMTKYR